MSVQVLELCDICKKTLMEMDESDIEMVYPKTKFGVARHDKKSEDSVIYSDLNHDKTSFNLKKRRIDGNKLGCNQCVIKGIPNDKVVLSLQEWKKEFGIIVAKHAALNPVKTEVKQSGREVADGIRQKKQKKEVRLALAEARKALKKKQMKKITKYFTKSK